VGCTQIINSLSLFCVIFMNLSCSFKVVYFLYSHISYGERKIAPHNDMMGFNDTPGIVLVILWYSWDIS